MMGQIKFKGTLQMLSVANLQYNSGVSQDFNYFWISIPQDQK